MTDIEKRFLELKNTYRKTTAYKIIADELKLSFHKVRYECEHKISERKKTGRRLNYAHSKCCPDWFKDLLYLGAIQGRHLIYPDLTERTEIKLSAYRIKNKGH